MIATRANWAATVPWDGVTGKPEFPGSVTDISQLTAIGFTNGKIPVWNAAQGKFRPGTLPSPSPTPTPSARYIDPVQFEWNVPALNPLQSVYEDFPLIGAVPATPAAVGVPFDMQFCWIRADVITNDSVRLTVLNMNGAVVDLGNGLYNVQLFQYAT